MIKREHYKIALVEGEDNTKCVMKIQIRSPYMNHVLMTFHVSNPVNGMEIFRKFLREIATTGPIMEILEAIGNYKDFLSDILKISKEYNDSIQ